MAGSESGRQDDDAVLNVVYDILVSDGESAIRENVRSLLPDNSDEELNSTGQGSQSSTSEPAGDSDEIHEYIEFDVDRLFASDQEVRIVEHGEERPPLELGDSQGNEERPVLVNIDSFKQDKKEEIVENIKVTYEAQGRLLTPEQEKEYHVVTDGIDDEKISEIVDYFHQYLKQNQVIAIRRGLFIRKGWEDDSIYVSESTMNEWKDDLDSQFDYGKTVANFCSSEYYDPEHILWEIVEQIQNTLPEENPGKEKITEVYMDVLSERPFVVYAGSDKKYNCRRWFVQKLKQYDTYPYEVPYVDIRGQGFENREDAHDIIRHVVDRVDEVIYLSKIGGKESVYRAYPDTISDLSGL